jgi:hypothetical protein
LIVGGVWIVIVGYWINVWLLGGILIFGEHVILYHFLLITIRMQNSPEQAPGTA